ncbi:MFS transporter [Paucibacter sp. KBW04]|uniref:MFS transporter n=1 Tax=Paucibacter sp. KBW04 TaxID=2153361 RepID=UPI000F5720F4|nr:MFS transporter [Paucibacter sp. KBW04]RQO62489.1 MFS transporter [Paucibacter sp. KBW04]
MSLLSSSALPNSASAAPAATILRTPTLLLMAVATGLCAGSNYFNQPLLHSIAQALNLSEGKAALTVTLAQVSYALGLLFLVPLGDKLERRSLSVGLMLLAALGLAISGFAPNFELLLLGTVMTGLFSVAAQVLVPMAATLSEPARSGRAVGLVMSGLLAGILLARSAAGVLSSMGSWQLVYRLGAVAMLALAALLAWQLPRSRNAQPAGYLQILASMAGLLRRYPRLRTRSLLGALCFGSMSVLFSTLALLLAGPGFELSDAQIGLVGLVGVVGALSASVVGRLADRGWAQRVSGASLLLFALSWAAFWWGSSQLGLLLLGILLIDIALPGVHLSNQNIIYRLQADARSRINAVYMTSYFIGAAGGSALGALAWQWGAWPASCGLGLGLVLLAAAVFAQDLRLARSHRRASGLAACPEAC